MFLDLVATLLGHALKQKIEVISLEEFGFPTALADQQMLVTGESGDKGLTAIRMMDALDQTKLFQLLQCAIDTDQPQGRVLFPGQIENLSGIEGSLAGSQRFYHHPPGFGEAVSAGFQTIQPVLFALRAWG